MSVPDSGSFRPSPPDPGRQPWGGRRRPPRRRRTGRWLVVFLAALAVLVFLLWRAFPEALADNRDQAWMVHSLLLLAVVGGSVVVTWRLSLGRTLRYGAVWLGIALIIALGYAYRVELTAVGERLLGGFLPHRGVIADDRVVLERRDDGHFSLEVTVDGTAVRFLVDTGASHVMLSQRDARRVGFDPDKLSYTIRYSTASGSTFGAPVRLATVDAGPIHMTDLPASVGQSPDAPSLLGMTFLNRLSGYQVSDGRLTLVP